MMPKYWIGVASREHVMRGVEGGYAMLSHGKRAPLEKIEAGDYLIYYSPRERSEDKEPLQKFAAIRDMKSWGYAFRFGHIEISDKDFLLIARAMEADIQ